jgi:O-antigen ligase
MAGMTLATASRSGFLSLGIVFMFLLFQRGVSWGFRFSVMGAMVACLMVVLLVLPRASYERLMNYSLDQSAHPEAWRSTQRRIETNEHALTVFRGAPFIGVGPGNFRWLHRELYPDSIAAGRPNHNSYLWAATEGGIITLFLYGVFFVFLWRDFRRAQALYPQSDELWHVTRFLRGFFMIYMFFSAFADFWLEVHLYLMAGLAMLLVHRLFATPAAEPESAPAAWPAPQPAGG